MTEAVRILLIDDNDIVRKMACRTLVAAVFVVQIGAAFKMPRGRQGGWLPAG